MRWLATVAVATALGGCGSSSSRHHTPARPATATTTTTSSAGFAAPASSIPGTFSLPNFGTLSVQCGPGGRVVRGTYVANSGAQTQQLTIAAAGTVTRRTIQPRGYAATPPGPYRQITWRLSTGGEPFLESAVVVAGVSLSGGSATCHPLGWTVSLRYHSNSG
jgi:hypothetical protein